MLADEATIHPGPTCWRRTPQSRGNQNGCLGHAGLLKWDRLPSKPAAGRHAIIDDRRGLENVFSPEVAERRRVGDAALSQSAAPACGLVLDGPLLPAIRGAAREPFAFTVLDIANGLTAGGAAVACRVAGRAAGCSWQPGRSHKGSEKKFELRDHAPAQASGFSTV